MSQTKVSSTRRSFLVILTGLVAIGGWLARGGLPAARAQSAPLPSPFLDPRELAPYVSTPLSIVEQMLELAQLKPGESLYDLGSGDGRILIMAAQKFGARAVGVELNERLYRESVARIKQLGLEKQIQVIYGDLLQVNLRPADVVTLYLLTSANERVRPHLENDLRSGSRVVSHDFRIPGWREEKAETAWDDNRVSHTLYLYRVPQRPPKGGLEADFCYRAGPTILLSKT